MTRHPLLGSGIDREPTDSLRESHDGESTDNRPTEGVTFVSLTAKLHPLFRRIGMLFIEKQTALFGTNHLYDADTFNEMDPPSGDPEFLKGVSGTIFQSMAEADPAAVWVLQGWFLYYSPAKFWTEERSRAFLGAVPDDRMIVLDLFGDQHPIWDKFQAFYGKPWIWNVVHNFGGKTSLNGDLPRMAANLSAALESPARGKFSGIGMMMEGFGDNPVVQDFIMDMVWRPGVPDLGPWIRRSGDLPKLRSEGAKLLEMIRDMDELLATREEFLLGKWIADAKRWAANEDESRLLEWNARNLITLWGPKCTEGQFDDLNGYAHKQWAGLFSGYYLPRWQAFLDLLEKSLKDGKKLARADYLKDACAWEQAWSRGREAYPDAPQGDPLAVAKKLMDNYGTEIFGVAEGKR